MEYKPSSTSTLSRKTYVEATKYSFNTVWFDKVADMDRQYVISIYVETSEIEIFDVHRKMVFLKRCSYPELDLSKFFTGNAVVIHGRQHTITGFANEFTKRALQQTSERTCAIIKPHAFCAEAIRDVLQNIIRQNLNVSRLQLSQFTQESAADFYIEHKEKQFFPQLMEMILEGAVMIFELVGENAVQKWREIIGATDPQKAAPNSLRAVYGKNVTKNAFHGSSDSNSALRELEIAFSLRPLCEDKGAVLLLQPRYISQFGVILQQIFVQAREQQLRVTGIHSADPVATDIDELFKAYQGVIPNYRQFCDQFDDGVVIAIQLAGENAIQKARDICGPFDPEIAKLLKPESIRAKFGKNIIENAIFVTDIEEEAEIHTDFWFKCVE